MKTKYQTTLKSTFISTMLSTCLLAPAANAAQWDVAITNLTNGNHFTPLFVTANNSTTHLFEEGAVASSAITLMAECGSLAELEVIDPIDADTKKSAAPLAPGASITHMIDTTSTNLTITAMVLPTNDAFVGMDAQLIPTAAGSYTFYLNAYDAGTEANNELLDSSGCAAGMAGIPAAPNGDNGMNGTGVAGADTNPMIHIHRGVLGDTNATGGASDLDSTIHRWQNPVAKVVVTVTP